MSDLELLKAICAAHDWYEALGARVEATPLGRFVTDPGHPDVWASNHVSAVEAATAEAAAALLSEMDVRFAHSQYRVAMTDPFTPPAFMAALAFADFQEQALLILMALEGELAPVCGPDDLVIRPVGSEADWREVRDLLVVDHREAMRTGRPHADEVTEGVFESFRRKAATVGFFLAELDGRPCAYLAAGVGPQGVGVLDEVFTLPHYRRRGVASRLIGHGVRHVRAAGAGVVFLGALAAEPPKRLYARLGFRPVMTARRMVRAVEP